MKVLYLTPWYPSERDAMAGLFVQKHVEAVRAQGVDVRVLYSLEWRDMLHQWRQLKREWGLPDVVQLNVIQKQGALALWLKRRYNIPYIIIEHWSGYLRENGQFMQMPATKQQFVRSVCRKASIVLTVSLPLQRAMQHCGLKAQQWGKIDNVVDEFFYQKSEVKSTPLRKLAGTPRNQNSDKKILLHVSCFDERAKNVKGLLRAAKIVADKRQGWQLVLVGTGIDYDEVRAYAQTLNFPEELLLWTGELTPQEVAEWMHKADAFVLSSRFETYGVVLAEAAAAGVTIISTPVGIAEEVYACIVEQDEVENHPEQFADKIEHVLFANLQPATDTANMQRFTSQAVGSKLKQIYEQVCTTSY